MPELELSDGQKVDPSVITCVTLYTPDTRLLVQMDDKFIKVLGSGAEDDAKFLDDLRDKHHLNYLVFRATPLKRS